MPQRRALPCGRHHVTVLAKAPRPGHVKTRLSPPFSPAEACRIAECALAETLEAVAACGADRRVVVLDGPPGPWLPPGFEIVPQGRGSLDKRLAAAWDHVGGRGVQIGMDTPQVTAAVLDDALDRLDQPGADAVLGPAADGGWWAIGLRRPDPAVFLGVPMSTPCTGAAQLERMQALGLTVDVLATEFDLDTVADAVHLARSAPWSRTGALVAELLGVGPDALTARRPPTVAPVPVLDATA